MAIKPTYEELEQKIKELESHLEQMEDTLRVSVERNRLATSAAKVGVWDWDIKTGDFYLDPNIKAILGYTDDEIPNDLEIWTKYVHTEDSKAVMEAAQAYLDGKTSEYRFEHRMLHKDGSIRWILVRGKAVRDENGNAVRLIGTDADITDRKQTEEALQKSQEDMKGILDATHETIILIDRQGKVITANQTACDRLKTRREDLIGRCIYDFFSLVVAEKRKRKYEEVFDTGKPVSFEDSREGMTFEQSVYPVFGDGGQVEKVVVFARDTTERSKLERMLQQSQKFEAIGTLAGGVAHDFNNLLMGIQGRVSLISVELEPSHPHGEHIKAIEDCIQSATHLTKQLLGFARGGKYEVRSIDINELLLGSATMFGRTKKEIHIHTNLQKSPPVVAADRRQIEQVLLNLYVNAWQAMPDGGELYLETKTVTLDDAYCGPYQAKPGRYAKISVADTGIGMDESIHQRIFDPFFTTKDKDRGTGLGLASAYGIIKNHAGIITVNSEVGQGTKFTIYLPISGKKVYREVPTETGHVKGSASILLVEDEEMIVEVGQAMLEKLGYRVVVAKDGKQAIDTIIKKGDGIDLVILDLIMPEMGGDKAFDLIRELQPAMPVILSSGYSLNGQANAIMRRGCNAFIQKPFNISELSQKVRKILDEAQDPARD